MQFFSLQGKIVDPQWFEAYQKQSENRELALQFKRKLQSRTVTFNNRHMDEAAFFAADIGAEELELCYMLLQPGTGKALTEEYLKELGIAILLPVCSEITRTDYERQAEISAYITNNSDIYCGYALDEVDEARESRAYYEEKLLEKKSETAIRERVQALLASDSFSPELDRIYAPSDAPSGIGHPVHYVLEGSDPENSEELCRMLLSALYANGRIQNRRYACLNLKPEVFRLPEPAWYGLLYRSCIGGTVVIRARAQDVNEEGDIADAFRDTVEAIAGAVRKYRNQVLTVLCIPRSCVRLWELFREYLGSMSFVELHEDLADAAQAREYLEFLASESRMTADDVLRRIPDPERTYFSAELKERFSEWQSAKLKQELYPQYADIEAISVEEKKAQPRGNAYQELEEMVGLGDAKQLLHEALAYFKTQKLFAARGLRARRPAMHMVFTGNPGTAKTTAARLFARILKDNGILTSGRFVECGRGDLVGKYVGWTAPAVQKKFEEAKGGVLFIDEAYSLVDDRDGSFGDEAINAIVQEMENRREEVLVIFAGYPDKMETFLRKNPGLRSRIAFHVPFADYTAEELCGITRLHAKREGMRFAEGAEEKLLTLYEAARRDPDFGNGRYARNVLERARMAQALRLAAMEERELTDSTLATLLPEDIPAPPRASKAAACRIGF